MARYVTADELKKFVKSEKGDDLAAYEDALNHAQQFLDDETDMYIAVASGSATAGSFRPATSQSKVLQIVNCVSITSVVENDTTLTDGTDFVAEPIAKPVGQARPYTRLRRVGGYWYWDNDKTTVTVTADWGWTAVPPGAKTACIMAAKLYLDGRDLKFGLAGLSEFGGVGDRDAKVVTDFIRDYRATWGVA